MEVLEGRRMLAGVVNISTARPGVLDIFGDDQENNVVIVSGATPGSYVISVGTDDANAATMFRLNGAAKQAGPISVSGINRNVAPGGNAAIFVDLAGGKDTLTINGTASGKTQFNGDLNILNEGTGDVNTITDVNVSNAFSINILDDLVVPAGIAAPGFAARPAANAPDPAVPARAGNATGVVNTISGSTIGGNVVINVGGGGVNTIQSKVDGTITTPMTVTGGLYVSAAQGNTRGQNRLELTSITVGGPTVVTNARAGSTTKVIDSTLRGLATPAPATLPAGPAVAAATNGAALTILNDTSGSSGNDIIHVFGSTVIGEETVNPAGTAPFSQNALIIRNGAGGSYLDFNVNAGGTVGPVVRGGLVIENGDVDPRGTRDTLIMNRATTFGGVYVYNAGGETNTMLNNSWLGRSTIPSTGYGNPVVIINDAGDDQLVTMNTTIPWGIYTNNDDAGGGLTFSEHRTAIMGSGTTTNPLTNRASEIGTYPVDFGVGGLNMTVALSKAFPTTFVGPTVSTGQFTAQAAPFLVNTASTTDINAVVRNVPGRVGDTITFDAGAIGNPGASRVITAAVTTQPQTLGSYNFAGGSPNVSNQSIHAVLGPVTAGAGLKAGVAGFNPNQAVVPANLGLANAASPVLHVDPTASFGDLTAAAAANSSYSFTVTPQGTAPLNFTTLAMDVSKGDATNPKIIGLRSSATGLTNLAALSITDSTQTPTFEHVVFDLSHPGLQGVVGPAPITFTIVLALPDAASSVQFDNITLAASVVGGTSTLSVNPPFANPPAVNDGFTIFGPSTFGFNLVPGGLVPVVGDTVTFTEGPNVGIGRGITGVDLVGGTFANVTFDSPFPLAPGLGDAFNITRINAPFGGTRTPALPTLLTMGDSLFVGGGSGRDVVNIGHNPTAPGATGAVVNPVPFGRTAQLSILLPGGENHVNIQGGVGDPLTATEIKQLRIQTGDGVDTVTIQDVKIDNIVAIDLALGDDFLNLLGLTTLPDRTLGGQVTLEGGLGGRDTLRATNVDVLLGLLLPSFERRI